MSIGYICRFLLWENGSTLPTNSGILLLATDSFVFKNTLLAKCTFDHSWKEVSVDFSICWIYPFKNVDLVKNL